MGTARAALTSLTLGADLGGGHLDPVEQAAPRVKTDVQLQPARVRIGFGPGRARVTDHDRRGIEQLDQCCPVTAYRTLGLTQQTATNIPENRRWPLTECIAQRRTAWQPQPQMIERRRLSRHPVAQLAQARKPAELRKQQGLQVADTSPATRPRPDPVVAIMRRHNPPHIPAIEGFQKAVQSARGMRHGRTPKSMSRQQRYWHKTQLLSAVQPTHSTRFRTAVRFRGDDGSVVWTIGISLAQSIHPEIIRPLYRPEIAPQLIAAIDGQHFAGDIPPGVAGQIGNGIGDVFHLAEPLHKV